MSQSGLAVLAGVSRTSIQNLEETLATLAPSKYLEPFVGNALTLAIGDKPTVNGRSQGNLKIYKSSFCAAVLKHYADPDVKLSGLTIQEREKQRNIAVQSCLRFIEIGIDSWIQDITGWNQRDESLRPHTDVYIKRIEDMRDHKIDDDLWMIFREASELLLLIEKDWRVPISQYDILDGSIGRKWSDYRQGQDWAGEVRSYQHKFKDKRGLRPCSAYILFELPYFRRWLKDTYVPEHLPQYLTDKYGKRATRQIYTEIGSLTNHILEITEIKGIAPAEERKFADFLRSRQSLLGGI
jgi:hypothetical protein